LSHTSRPQHKLLENRVHFDSCWFLCNIYNSAQGRFRIQVMN
jgi:hypothetical protein